MGTSGSYSGAGGAAGIDVSEGLDDWLDSLVGAPDAEGDPGPEPDAGEEHGVPGGEIPSDHLVTPLPAQAVTGILNLIRPRNTGGSGGADGPGAGGGVGGATSSGGGTRTKAGSGRSAQRLSSVGGRAAVGAHAFATGNVAGLTGLGLDYAELSALNDAVAVAQRIVEAACGQQGESTLESQEERYVAATVAEWVLVENQDSASLELDEIARFTLATIMAEIFSSELAVELHDRPDDIAAVSDAELRQATMILADQADLSVSGPSESEMTKAIEQGIETLRAIYVDGS